jgi:hypothetical protein
VHWAPSGRAGRTEWLRSLGGALVCLLAVAACSASAPGTSGKVTISPAVTSASGADISPAATGRVLSAALPPSGILAAGATGGVDRGLAHRAPACATSRPPGWVAAENARAGTPERAGAEDGDAVLGYFDRGSVGCGDRVGVHLGVAPGQAARRVWLAAYRIGWYGGAGARLAWRSPTLWVTARAVPSGMSAPHLVTPSWPTSLSVSVDAGWLPGFYLVVPQDAAAGGGPAGPAVPLVVRDDGGIEPILFKASTLTWNAYNDWGGWSLYHGPNGSHVEAVADRARVVALHRPLTGSGYRQLNLMDLPVVRLAEQLSTSRRIDVAYTTDVDVDRDPAQLLHHAEVVSGGHSEYWTASMYDGLQAAAAAGTNLVFLGANNLWWHTRLEGGGAATGAAPASSGAAEPDREVVYRLLSDDPAARIDPQAATVQWQIAPLFRDPAALLGQSHAAIGVDGSLQLLDAPGWFTAGTGLRAGAILPEAVGNEADGFNPRGHNPANTQIFAAALLTGGHGPVLVSTSYSTQLSGAAVFAAGSTDWACAPIGTCADKTIPAGTGRLVAALTRNVLLALSTPKAGLTHPARATPVMNATTHAPHLAPAAIGSYGGADGDGNANRTGQ